VTGLALIDADRVAVGIADKGHVRYWIAGKSNFVNFHSSSVTINLNPAVKNEKKGQLIVYEWVTRKRTRARVATKFYSFYDH